MRLQRFFDPYVHAAEKAAEEAVKRITEKVYGQPNRRPWLPPPPPQDRETDHD